MSPLELNHQVQERKLLEEEVKLTVTKTLLEADRKRAADVLLQLQYQFSRTTSYIEVK